MRHDPSDPGFQRFLNEIDDHFVYVVGDLLRWTVLDTPEFKVGGGNVVLRFKTADGLFVFRVPVYGQEQLRRVALAYQHFAASGLLPEVVYRDGKCVLERYVEGVPLSARASDDELRLLAQKLAMVHAIPSDKFGLLSHGTTGLYSDAEAYYVERSGRVLPEADAEEELTPAERSTLAALAHEASLLPDALRDAPCHLGHGDLWRSNILLGPQGIRFIDWDQIGSYPREHDFVFMVDADLSTRQKVLVMAHYPHALEPTLLRWYSLCGVVWRSGVSQREKLALAARHGLLG